MSVDEADDCVDNAQGCVVCISINEAEKVY
jgi:hypothetical protein